MNFWEWLAIHKVDPSDVAAYFLLLLVISGAWYTALRR